MLSTFSGILDVFSYVGASVSSYDFAAIADIIGWNTVIISWCVIALSVQLFVHLKSRARLNL